MKKSIILIIFLKNITTLFAQYPVVNTNHPRTWIDSARISTLQSQISLPGDAQDTYNDVLYAYNNWWINDPQLYLEGSDSTLWTWDWSSIWAGYEAQLTVFFYKMTDDTLALKRCRFIARQVINLIDTVDFSTMTWFEKENLLRKLSDNDFILDQCYDDFPTTLRDSLTQRLYVMNREFMNTYILSNAGNSYVSSHNTWNNIYCNQNALTLYNNEGLTAPQKDTVVQWYQTIYDKHVNGFIPCWSYYRDDDGGWNWGAAYSMWSLIDQFQFFENMRIGTDKNFYIDLPWVENSINQYVYFMRPDNKSIHLGDGQTSLSPDRVMFLHAKIFNDPRSQWMSQYYSQSQFMLWTIPKFNKIVYKDFSQPTVTQPYLPLNWWADKVGLSVSRSSWDSNSTMVTFFNSPSKKAAHEHRDNNSFSIFKNAPLLLDAGYYDFFGSTHYRNYYERTIAHNTICVFDSTEVFTTLGQPVSNDGGQIESVHLKNYNEIFLPENQRGKWVKYASGANYEYNIADAQLSYDSTKLDFFRRRLLYLKPNKVIVLDHIHLQNTATKQRDIQWIAHFAQQPNINGSLINTSIPNHITTHDGNEYTTTNGNGSLAIKTLLPNNTTATLVGGAGYEYWVNGTNYPPSTDPDTTFFSPGNWRIEVRPTTLSDTVVYLHTISIGDSSSVAIAGGTSMQNTFSVGADWNDTLFFFSNDADTGKVYHVFYHVQGNRTVKIFATDLTNGVYDIKVDGLIFETASTDVNGIIESSIILPAGNHEVEISPNTTGINEVGIAYTLMIFPNPANSEINIAPPTLSTPFETKIYDEAGKLVLKISNQIRITISHLPIGQYYVQMKQAGKKYSTKFIKQK